MPQTRGPLSQEQLPAAFLSWGGQTGLEKGQATRDELKPAPGLLSP